jgi:hypothetical protein
MRANVVHPAVEDRSVVDAIARLGDNGALVHQFADNVFSASSGASMLSRAGAGGANPDNADASVASARADANVNEVR